MAVKTYKNMSEEFVVGGAKPGEVFDFDYDLPGYNEKSLLDSGIIKLVSKPQTKSETKTKET